MLGCPAPHPALLVSSNMKWTYAVKADMPIVGISEGPEHRLFEVPFANTQCEAVRGRIPLC